MFRRRTEDQAVTITFEGAAVRAREGDSVAAALLAAGHLVFRETPVSGAPRGPFCMMGACFDCLVEIDSQPARQACMVRVAEGMRVRRQHGAADYAAAEAPE
jgi:predicted molibdopterin-dependent oxidoreductase YjgC